MEATSFRRPEGAFIATPLSCSTEGDRKSKTKRGTFTAGAQLKNGSRGIPQYSHIWVGSAVRTILVIHARSSSPASFLDIWLLPRPIPRLLNILSSWTL